MESLKKDKFGTKHHENKKSNDQEESLLDYASECIITNNLTEANGWKTGAGEVIEVKFDNLSESTKSHLKGGEIISVEIIARANIDLRSPILGFTVRDRLGQELFGENTLPFTDMKPISIRSGGTIKAEFEFQLPMLPNGKYTVMASLADGDLNKHIQHHFMHDALILNVISSKVRWGLVGIMFKKVSLEIV
jgi:lipopolysaccharide transport system ATP-binding protein